MYSLIKPLLFRLDPETAHDLTLNLLKYIPKFIFPKLSPCPKELFGLKFPHKIGLAAGLDKNGAYIDDLAKLGFAFIEIGTVTPRAQFGNPKPRLFRISEKEAIINRFGFNNYGVDALVSNVQKAKFAGILGINIGKNKDVALKDALADYAYCMDRVYSYASYITVNISSPNTEDLRLLQAGKYFTNLVANLKEKQNKLSDKHKKYVPVLVKISPDESEENLKNMAQVMLEHKIDGIIATNTTVDKSEVTSFAPGNETGGLSGKPLLKKATKTLQIIKDVVGDELPIIGVGGITDADSAIEKLTSGASLLQVYTGLIYKGPKLLAEISECK